MEATIRRLEAAEIDALIPALSAVLIDCVQGGASVSFMHPLSRARADEFWHDVAARAACGAVVLLVAEHDGEIVGTVQLCHAGPENQRHRADVAKMLVHRRARRRGIGAVLLRAVEAQGRLAGKTLLVLDTVTGGDGEKLYARMGWIRVGVVPGYALFPDGALCDTTVFYRRLLG